ncbi:MAG TPA: colanic acid biosynthesis acetyltransferase WcaF [Opitutaceae bacterium]|nr:colanic acid biosynthesis acetyltransferase WcaF [Opitutaceae bacterium]
MTEPAPASRNWLGRNSPSPWTRGERFKRALWLLVETLLFRPTPRTCHRWRVWLLSVFGAKIDEPSTVRVFPNARIHFPWKLELRRNCMVGPGVLIYNLDRVTIGAGANLSRNIHVCAGSHDFNRWSMPLVTAPIAIGDNVWIATDCFIGPGVTIGELCVVGARSVVVDDLPARKICVGHPCRPVKDRVEPAG